LQIGIDTFAASFAADTNDPKKESDSQKLQNVLHEIELADKLGLDVFGIGEHHRKDFLDSAPAVILGAVAARTTRIRLSAVTVLSAADPVRVFQEFATVDLISQGRTEMVAGRGSFIEAFPLFGYNLSDYDELYEEKLQLLLKIRDNEKVTWSGKFRSALNDQGVYPRPVQNPFPIWIGTGGTPESFLRAGKLGLPLMVAIIGGETADFAPYIDLYRRTFKRSGHPEAQMKVGMHSIGYVADTAQKAADEFFPGYAKAFTKIGRERGWGPVTRSQFAACRRSGASRGKNPSTQRSFGRTIPPNFSNGSGFCRARKALALYGANCDSRRAHSPRESCNHAQLMSLIESNSYRTLRASNFKALLEKRPVRIPIS
jgi:probable LLM family oxidoreductase